MNRKIKNVVAISLAALLATTGVFADHAKYKKEETVYAISNPDGSVDKKMVSVWVHADDKNIDIDNATELKNVQNIKGDEKIEVENFNIRYKSENSDIYYRGETDKKLSFSISMKYYLDGNEIAPADLAHKSGNVKMIISAKNNAVKTVKINGKKQEIYLPVFIAGTINLPTEKFKSVKVNHGEVLNDSKNQIMSFITVPGMKESFNFRTDKLNEKWDKLAGDIEINAEVTDFELEAPMFIVTTSVPALEHSDDMNDVVNDLGKFKDKARDLLTATKTLKNGQSTFNGKLEDYTVAVAKLSAAAKQLFVASVKIADKSALISSGAIKLNAASKSFVQGITTFSAKSGEFLNGINTLTKGANQLMDGLNKYAEGAIKVAEGSKQLTAGVEKVQGGVAAVNDGLKQANSSMQLLADKVKASEAEAKESLTKQIGVYKSMLAGTEAILKDLNAMVASGAANDSVKVLLQKMMVQKVTLEKMIAASNGKLQALNNSNSAADVAKLAGAYGQISGKLDELNEGSKVLVASSQKLGSAADMLNGKTPAIKEGIAKLNAGHDKLKAGSVKLNEGAKAISVKTKEYLTAMESFTGNLNKFHREGTVAYKNSMSQFKEKINQLSANNPKLLAGEKKLLNGSTRLHNELRNALNKNNSADIDAVVKDISKLTDIKAELDKFSEESNYFVENLDGANQKVKYVVKLKGIK